MAASSRQLGAGAKGVLPKLSGRLSSLPVAKFSNFADQS
jgi:ribosomal protein S3